MAEPREGKEFDWAKEGQPDEASERTIDAIDSARASTAPEDVRDEVNADVMRDTLARAARERENPRVEKETGHTGIGAVGGAVGGALAGAAVGTVTLGPIGSIIGIIAGALGGSWVGMASEEDVYTPKHEALYREHYESSPNRLVDRSFEQVRPAYQLGHLAARNPEYRGRPFALIEPELRRAWTGQLDAEVGSWEVIRPWVQSAYESSGDVSPRDAAQSDVVVGDASDPRTVPDSPEQGKTFADLDIGGTAGFRRASFSDPIPPGNPDRVPGEEP